MRVRVEAQRRIYRLDTEGLDEVKKWLFGKHRVWGGRAETAPQLSVAALERALSRESAACCQQRCL